MKYAELKAKWQGKSTMEDPKFGAQCVAWAKKAASELYGVQLGSFSGSALAGWNSGSPFDGKWKRVKNSASAVPKSGSVVFFDKIPVNPYGHVAITGDGCTATKLVVLEQNAGSGNGNGIGTNAITERTLDYIKPAKCLGWFEFI